MKGRAAMKKLAAGTVVLDRYTLVAPTQMDACYGTVAPAHDQRFGREVELLIAPQPRGTTGGDLWMRRAESVAVLQHAALPQVLDLGIYDSYGVLVYRQASGRLLSHIPAVELRSWTFRQALQCVAQLATALGLAHTHGLAHGSFSARSVLLEREGTTSILDLVWPRQQTGGDRNNAALKLRLGVSPEPGADVTALGEILWHLTTAIGPGTGRQLKAAVYDVIRRATTLDARSRYADGNTLARAIERLYELPEADTLVPVPQPRMASSPPRAAVAASRYRSPATRPAHRANALAPIALGLAIALFPLADALAHATLGPLTPFFHVRVHPGRWWDGDWHRQMQWQDSDRGSQWPQMWQQPSQGGPDGGLSIGGH
jgi:hypothetical protein